jgi:hypothetical protein
MRIVVAEARAPGSRESEPTGTLVRDLRQRGHDVETVTMPFGSGAQNGPLEQASAWRLLDLSTAGGRTIDLLIATGFPAYFARHPRKVAWLAHSHDVPPALAALDVRMRAECARIVTAPVYDARLVEQLLG